MNQILFIILSISQLISLGNFGVWNLRCDEKINPVGVLPTQVSFTWESQAQQRIITQTDYRIVVASSPELLSKGKYDVWDSKRTASSNNVHILYGGAPLKPATKYYWKVMVWNGKGKSSKWSDPATFVTSLATPEDWKGARWIGYEEMPAEDRLVPGIHGLSSDIHKTKLPKRATVPYFRKQVATNNSIREAYLFITGLGHYDVTLNGEAISKSFLAPGWTHYDKRVLYNTYDVTKFMLQGDNTLGVTVGNGFHYINRERYLKLGIAFGYPKMICRLKVVYKDGTEANFISDESWKTSPSPTTYSSIYGGEDYDAQKEQPNWNKNGFDDRSWKRAMAVSAPGGVLSPETDYPLQLFEAFPYAKVMPTDNNLWTYDFGQNASGIIEIKVKGKKGQVVKIHPGELLKINSEVNQGASGGPHYYTYTLKGDGEEVWRPQFTYYGFRYATVEGARPHESPGDGSQPLILELSLLHNRNSNPQVSTFESSSELMNRIHSLIDWAIRSNMQSVMTDCPHREKLGWLEQTHLMGNSIRYNYSIYHLYRKQIQDMMDAQLENGLVPDIAPEYVEFLDGFRDSPEWGSAAVLLPWMVYKWYGDKQVLATAYSMMDRYVTYLKGTSQNHIVSHGLGDWFDYGPKQPGVAQLTPIPLTATAIYFYDVKLLSEIAKSLGKHADAQKYATWAAEIKKAFNAKFYNAAEKTYATGSQTSIAMPLCVGLVDESEHAAVMATLNRSIDEEGYKLTAGDVGFHYLVAALSDGGYSETLYKLVNRDDVPGYGFQLAKGATALTESWPALENVSNNHLMLGHIMEWFYTCVLGIKDAPEAIACDKVIIAPTPVGDITWAKGHYVSPRGKIVSDWKIVNGKMTLKVTIPDNVTAEVIFPKEYKRVEESMMSVFNRQDVKASEKDGAIHIVTYGGSFEFEATK